MAFSLIGTHVPVELEDPEVVAKTCPTFFDSVAPDRRGRGGLPVTVVAIDGPAGAGKSSVARAVADRLGFTYLDSGAMYRCVALAVLRRGLPPAEVAAEVSLSLGDRVLLDGEDVTAAIRAPEVSEAASVVAADAGRPDRDGGRAAPAAGRRRLGRRGP